MIQTRQDKEITLALSGGAVRACAHIGVIKALKEEGFKISAVSGSSAGAMVGYLLASRMQIDDMLDFILSIKKREIFYPSFKTGFFKLDKLENRLISLNRDREHSKLDIPLYCAVSNLKSANIEYLNSGDAIKNAIASSALSPIFSPVNINGNLYIDGGFRDNLPAYPLKKYNLPIIGVDVNSMPKREVKGLFSLTLNTVMVMLRGTALNSSKMCNSYIKLDSVSNMPLFDISLVKEAFDLGYKETKERIKEINNAIKS